MARSKPNSAAAGRCPVCGTASEASVRPFCTRRCADIDLLRWLRGGYVVAGREEADEDGVEEEGPDAAVDSPTGDARRTGNRRHEDE